MQYSALPGWFAYETLYDYAISRASDKGKLVEVGCWFGRGLVYLAKQAKSRDLVGEKTLSVYGVLSYTGAPALMDNLVQCGVYRDVTVLPMHSADAVKLFDDKSLSFVFLDHTITKRQLIADIQLWLTKVGPGGMLAGAHYRHQGVKSAVTEVFGCGDHTCQVCPECWETQL